MENNRNSQNIDDKIKITNEMDRYRYNKSTAKISAPYDEIFPRYSLLSFRNIKQQKPWRTIETPKILLIRQQFQLEWINTIKIGTLSNFHAIPTIFHCFIAILNFIQNQDLTDNPETIANRSKADCRRTPKIISKGPHIRGHNYRQELRRKNNFSGYSGEKRPGGGRICPPLDIFFRRRRK